MSESLPQAVILNPRAGAGRGADAWALACRDAWGREVGLASLPRYAGTPSAEELSLWMLAQLTSGHRNFLACGGDGTLNLAINAILRSPELAARARLGALALGSSNDFHKPFDAPARRRVAGRPARVAFAEARPHDLGIAVMPDARRAFAINASVGVTAEANAFFNRSPGPLKLLKRRWVDGAIVASALLTFARYRNLELEVGTGGSASRRVLLTNLSVIKNRHFSGSFRYGSGPAPDDGRVHVHLCERMSRLEMLGTLAALSRGRFPSEPKTSSQEATQAGVRSATGAPFAIETDGEVSFASEVRFEVLPRGVLLCP